MSIAIRCRCVNWSEKSGCCMNRKTSPSKAQGLRRQQNKTTLTPGGGLQRAISSMGLRGGKVAIDNAQLPPITTLIKASGRVTNDCDDCGLKAKEKIKAPKKPRKKAIKRKV